MKREQSSYDRLRPLIVWLGLVELYWIGRWLLAPQSQPSGYAWTVVFWIAVMLAWMGAVSYLAVRGGFLKHTRLLPNLAGFTSVVAFAALLFAVVPAARDGVALAARGTPDGQLTLIHVFRLMAIGTVIKYLHGELPLHFVLLGSLPDLLFAISAVVVTLLATTGPLHPNFLIAWHVIGASVFLGAGISMCFSVPSPLRIYYGKPDTSIVFRFPMVLAPNFTVPLFVIAHLFALVKLLG